VFRVLLLARRVVPPVTHAVYFVPPVCRNVRRILVLRKSVHSSGTILRLLGSAGLAFESFSWAQTHGIVFKSILDDDVGAITPFTIVWDDRQHLPQNGRKVAHLCTICKNGKFWY
jgi:hypothetical protein